MADSNDTEDKGFVRGGVERLVAMSLWLLTKNHLIDYLMTFEVSPGPQPSNEIMIRVPKWDGAKPVLEADRRERLAEGMQFLQESCYPGKFFTEGHAAQVNLGEDDKGPFIKVTSIGKGNRGTDMLRLVMARQFRDEAQRRSLEHHLHHR